MVRRATVEMKRPLFDKELVYIYEDYMHKKYEKGIEFSSMIMRSQYKFVFNNQLWANLL